MTPTPDDGSGPLDVDAAFAEIVARWGDDTRSDDAGSSSTGTGTGSGDGDSPGGGSANAGDGSGGSADGRSTDAPPSGSVDGSTSTGTAADEDGTGPGRHAMPPRGRPDASAEGSRTVRPAQPLPPAPREDVPVVPPASSWGEHVPSPTGRDRAADDLDPAELAFLSESFVPEEPRPLPRDLIGWAAWVAVVGAPLFLLVVALGWRDVPQLVTAITAGVFVAGFATLVVRLPSSRDDDGDDGAVV